MRSKRSRTRRYNTRALRKTWYGHPVHHRYYGRDFAKRLQNAGFHVDRIDYASQLGGREKDLFSIDKSELFSQRNPIFLCRRA